jgi:uncharacterized protein DUF732
MKFAVGGFATTVFALLAIATAPLATASQDTEFLDALASNGLTVPLQARLNVINAGHSVCRDLANGDSFKQTVSDIANRGLGGSRGLATTFVTAATTSLCPEFVGQLG